MVIFVATIPDVTSLTITVLASLPLPALENATSTRPTRMTAVPVNWSTVFCTLAHVITSRKTAHSTPVMDNATKIRLQCKLQLNAVPSQEKLSTTEACVISRMGRVHRDITYLSTVSVTTTGRLSTLMPRVETSVDITSMAGATITRAVVLTTIMRLTVSAFVGHQVPIPCQRV